MNREQLNTDLTYIKTLLTQGLSGSVLTNNLKIYKAISLLISKTVAASEDATNITKGEINSTLLPLANITDKGAIPNLPSPTGKYLKDDLTWDTPAGGPGGSGDMLVADYDPAGIVEQLVGLIATQTLTNKTLTSPVINSPTGITKSDVGLSNVDNTSDVNKPVSTLQSSAISSAQTAAEAYADGLIASIIATAPTTLDTLDELAAALGDDPNFATTVLNALGNRLRVDTASQGLSGTEKTNAKTNLDLQNVVNLDTSTTANITDSTNKRFMSDAQETKLDSVESSADITDAANVGAVVLGVSTKATPVGADTIPIIDSSDNTLKKLTWTTIVNTIQLALNTVYQAILVSGTNIKTINGSSILGSGDLTVSGGSGQSLIKYSSALNTNVSINSATPVSVFTKSLTDLAVGDVVELEINGNILNNSTATRTYRHTITLGTTTITLIDGTTIAFSATNKAVHTIKVKFSIIATNIVHVQAELIRGVPGAINTGQSIAVTTVREAWNTSTNNETGTKSITYSCHGQNATATQTFELRAAKVSVIPTINL